MWGSRGLAPQRRACDEACGSLWPSPVPPLWSTRLLHVEQARWVCWQRNISSDVFMIVIIIVVVIATLPQRRWLKRCWIVHIRTAMVAFLGFEWHARDFATQGPRWCCVQGLWRCANHLWTIWQLSRRRALRSGAASAAVMRVFIHAISGRQCELHVDPDLTVSVLKTKIAEEWGIPSRFQVLFHGLQDITLDANTQLQAYLNGTGHLLVLQLVVSVDRASRSLVHGTSAQEHMSILQEKQFKKEKKRKQKVKENKRKET